MQGVLYCAANHVGRLRFNSKRVEIKEGKGGVSAGEEGAGKTLSWLLRSRTPTPSHRNLTRQHLPYHSMYTFHKVNVYDICTHTDTHAVCLHS